LGHTGRGDTPQASAVRQPCSRGADGHSAQRLTRLAVRLAVNSAEGRVDVVGFVFLLERVVTLTFASWNRVVPWLRTVDELRRAA
jgi:hypothetical protein